jgi:hypothetical protein
MASCTLVPCRLNSTCGYAAFTVMPPDAVAFTASYTIDLLRARGRTTFAMTSEVVWAPGYHTFTECS